MEQQVVQEQPGSGVDKALVPVLDLFFRWVLVLLYGSRLGETKAERATRWGMVAIVAIALVGGGVYLGTRKSGRGRRITRPSRTTGPGDTSRRPASGSGPTEYPSGNPADAPRMPTRPGDPAGGPRMPTRPGDPAGGPPRRGVPPRRGSVPERYVPRDPGAPRGR